MRRVFLSALIAAGLLLALLAPPIWAQVTNFTSITLSNNLIVGNSATIRNDASVADDLTTTDLIWAQQTAQTITAGGTITPTGAYHQITAAAARGTSSVVVGSAGHVVTLVNVGSNTITLTDTGTLKLAGNAALGQYDNITLISDGTNWIQLSKTDN